MNAETVNISDLVRLKKTDQIFLGNLLLMTPVMVQNLEKNKVNISRPYKSWSDISNSAIRTFLNLLKREK
jgi:hypothetical protein